MVPRRSDLSLEGFGKLALIGHAALTPGVRSIDLRGVPDSGGIWAPSLSYHGGLFYLIYTIVRSAAGPFKDVHNYLTTAREITRP